MQPAFDVSVLKKTGFILDEYERSWTRLPIEEQCALVVGATFLGEDFLNLSQWGRRMPKKVILDSSKPILEQVMRVGLYTPHATPVEIDIAPHFQELIELLEHNDPKLFYNMNFSFSKVLFFCTSDFFFALRTFFYCDFALICIVEKKKGRYRNLAK